MKKLLIIALLFWGCERYSYNYNYPNVRKDHWLGNTEYLVINIKSGESKWFSILEWREFRAKGVNLSDYVGWELIN